MSDERLEKTQHGAPSASPATAPALETLDDAQRFLQEARHFTDEVERRKPSSKYALGLIAKTLWSTCCLSWATLNRLCG